MQLQYMVILPGLILFQHAAASPMPPRQRKPLAPHPPARRQAVPEQNTVIRATSRHPQGLSQGFAAAAAAAPLTHHSNVQSRASFAAPATSPGHSDESTPRSRQQPQPGSYAHSQARPGASTARYGMGRAPQAPSPQPGLVHPSKDPTPGEAVRQAKDARRKFESKNTQSRPAKQKSAAPQKPAPEPSESGSSVKSSTAPGSPHAQAGSSTGPRRGKEPAPEQGNLIKSSSSASARGHDVGQSSGSGGKAPAQADHGAAGQGSVVGKPTGLGSVKTGLPVSTSGHPTLSTVSPKHPGSSAAEVKPESARSSASSYGTAGSAVSLDKISPATSPHHPAGASSSGSGAGMPAKFKLPELHENHVAAPRPASPANSVASSGSGFDHISMPGSPAGPSHQRAPDSPGSPGSAHSSQYEILSRASSAPSIISLPNSPH